jgi:hypothetical protein
MSFRDEFVAIAEDPGVSLLVDFPKLQLDSHPDLEVIEFTIHDLSGQFHAVIQLDYPDSIWRLIGILMRRDTDDGIGKQRAFFLDLGIFQFLTLALRTDQTRRKKFRLTFGALVGLETVSLRDLSPIS